MPASIRSCAALRTAACGRVATAFLDTTALVHDSYLRFVNAKSLDVSGRNHFLAYASKVMRSVIVDLIREANAERRGGGQFDVTLNTAIAGASSDSRTKATRRCLCTMPDEAGTSGSASGDRGRNALLRRADG